MRVLPAQIADAGCRWAARICLGLLLLSLILPPASAQAPALVLLDLPSRNAVAQLEALDISVYARLGPLRLLAGATASQQALLQTAGVALAILDEPVEPGRYYLIYPTPRTSLNRLAVPTLVAEERLAVVKADPHQVEALAAEGFGLRHVPAHPMALQPHTEGAIPQAIEPDPFVAALLGQVDSNRLAQWVAGLSGDSPIIIGGQSYRLVVRHTYSGAPISLATQYIYEQLEALGLEVRYHVWGGETYPNVIGERPGVLNPADVVILAAHLDDLPLLARAPGADDNASGVAALLVAAEILSPYRFGPTLRFVVFTGEEQGMLGSDAYAFQAYQAGENIVGVVNLDMLGWESDGAPVFRLDYDPTIPDSVALAELFADVVGVYSLDLVPSMFEEPLGRGDHASFWNYGYAATMGIEDYPDDFNPYYHTSQDKLARLNLAYWTGLTKAALATVAHLLIPPYGQGDLGALDGYVTDAETGEPLAGALVQAWPQIQSTVESVTDPMGYYTMTLAAGVYSLGVQATCYQGSTVEGVVVEAGQVTHQDAALQPGQVVEILFADDMEMGELWSGTGLWHLADDSPCTAPEPGYSSPTHAWYSGFEARCTYAGGPNTSKLTQAGEVSLAPELAAAALIFSSWEETECGGLCYYDRRTVLASTDGGASWASLGALGNEGRWYRPSFDLSAYVGQPIKLRFQFATGGPHDNQHVGWLVDDVVIAGSTCSDPREGTMHVDSMKFRGRYANGIYRVKARVRVADAFGLNVAGAEVFAVLASPDRTVTGHSLTGTDGYAAFKLASRTGGTWSAEVTSVQKDGWTYDPDANVGNPGTFEYPPGT